MRAFGVFYGSHSSVSRDFRLGRTIYIIFRDFWPDFFVCFSSDGSHRDLFWQLSRSRGGMSHVSIVIYISCSWGILLTFTFYFLLHFMGHFIYILLCTRDCLIIAVLFFFLSRQIRGCYSLLINFDFICLLPPQKKYLHINHHNLKGVHSLSCNYPNI